MKHTVISGLICIWKSALLGRVGVDWGCQEGKFWNFLAVKQESIFFLTILVVHVGPLL